MKNNMKEKRNTKKSTISFVFTNFVISFFVAIFIGMIVGSILSNKSIDGNLQKIDIEPFEAIVQKTLPIIDNVYNSKNTGMLSSSSLIDSIKAFYMEDVVNPISILDAKMSGLYSYYMSQEYKENTHISENPVTNDENRVEEKNASGTISLNDVPESSTSSNNETVSSLPSYNDVEKAESIKDTIENRSDSEGKISRGTEGVTSSISTEDIEKEELHKGEIESTRKITIRNETEYKLNIDELIKEPLNFQFNKKKDEVLIYHTHTTESYISNISQLNSLVSTRSMDSSHSVVRVGDELTKNLEKSFGIQVVHNTTVHDYPDFNKAYANSLKTVTAVLKKDSDIKIAIDLHRDAIAGNKLREVTNVKGKNAAKIMFVVATGENKNNHPNWKENFKLALKLQEKLNEMCPELTLPIFLSKNRFNQHVSKGALLIEIGGDGNLMDECLESTKYLAKAINNVIK